MKHLPECPNHCINVPADYMERDVYMRRCICEKLRACEERVLDAAREAVVVLCWRKQYEAFVSTVDPQRVLAAIDALKEGK